MVFWYDCFSSDLSLLVWRFCCLSLLLFSLMVSTLSFICLVSAFVVLLFFVCYIVLSGLLLFCCVYWFGSFLLFMLLYSTVSFLTVCMFFLFFLVFYNPGTLSLSRIGCFGVVLCYLWLFSVWCLSFSWFFIVFVCRVWFVWCCYVICGDGAFYMVFFVLFYYFSWFVYLILFLCPCFICNCVFGRILMFVFYVRDVCLYVISFVIYAFVANL